MPIMLDQQIKQRREIEKLEAEVIREIAEDEGPGLTKRLLSVDWENFFRDLFPFTRWLINYKIEDLPFDIVAGITVGLTLVPQCLSYAAICNVRSEFGLYSSFLGQFVYFLFGTSKDGSVGPTAITSMMMGMVNGMFNPLAGEGDNTYNAFITFITGLVLIGIGVLKLGFIVSLFSIPVVSGFTTAAGFVIIGSQVKSLFGLSKAPNDSPGAFVKQMKNIYDRRAEIKPYDVLCGVVVMATLFSFQYTPVLIAKAKEWHSKRTGKPIPPPGPNEQRFMAVLNLIVASRNVIVFIAATGVAYHFYSIAEDSKKFEKETLSLVGYIKPGLPTWQFPAKEIVAVRPVRLSNSEAANLTAANASGVWLNETGAYQNRTVVLKTMSEIVADLSAYIIIIPLMTMLELFAITKALGRKNGYQVNATNELLGVGLANFLQSFLNAFPATTTISRCALNDQCRVRTQLGSIISAIIVIITLVVLTPLFYFIPKACLAGIMICAGYNLVDINIIIHMWKESPRDVFVLAGSFILCLFYDIAYGILICILLNMVIFLRPIIDMPLHLSHQPMVMRKGLKSDQHIVTIVKIPSGIEYPSCDRFIEAMTVIIANSAEKYVVIDCQFVTRVDYSGIQAFRGLIMLAFKTKKHLIFTNFSSEMLKKFQTIGLEHFEFCESVDDAVRHHHWAVEQGFRDGDNSIAHIATMVAPSFANLPIASQASRSRLSKAQSMAKLGSPAHARGQSVDDVEDQPESDDAQVPELGQPITTKQLGTAWQHDGGLFSASFASMWVAANLAPTDQQTIKEWQKTANMRHLASKSSMAHHLSRANIKPAPPQTESDERPYSSDEEAFIKQVITARRRSSGINILSHRLSNPRATESSTQRMEFVTPTLEMNDDDSSEDPASPQALSPQRSGSTGSRKQIKSAYKRQESADRRSIVKIEESDEQGHVEKVGDETKT